MNKPVQHFLSCLPHTQNFGFLNAPCPFSFRRALEGGLRGGRKEKKMSEDTISHSYHCRDCLYHTHRKATIQLLRQLP
jgi:hypothetical protein